MTTRRDFLAASLSLAAGADLLPRPARAREAGAPGSPGWLAEMAAQIRTELRLPAVWVAAAMDGRVEAAVVGVRKLGDATPAAVEDRLTVASISKPMAGFWIATLVDQGRLDYGTRVLEVLPELGSACLPEHRDVTLGQLLTHTAGLIRNAASIPDPLRVDQYPSERLRQAREVLSTPAPPGSKGKELYSNGGVTLAATMAERVAREPYETAAGRFYRERLGLPSWDVWPRDRRDDLSLPWPHALEGGMLRPRSPRSLQRTFVQPSGGAVCGIEDLVRFGLIATNASPLSRQPLRPETWARVLAPVPNTAATYAGFFASGDRRFRFGHAGSLRTTNSNLIVYPEWQAAIALHTNAATEEFRGRATDLLQDALRKRRAGRHPAPPCRIALTGVATVDAAWKHEIAPRAADKKVRVRVNFRIEAAARTGDLLTVVSLGGVERRDNRYRGLAPGDHTLRFEFDLPKNPAVPLVVTLDALGTAGNRLPRLAQHRSVLMLR